MNRTDLKNLAKDRISEAKVLLAAKKWGAAYYLAGYAIECGLKSCILVRLSAEPELIFEMKRYSERCWTHDLSQLVDLAGIKADLDADAHADSLLSANWNIVKEWMNQAATYVQAKQTPSGYTLRLRKRSTEQCNGSNFVGRQRKRRCADTR